MPDQPGYYTRLGPKVLKYRWFIMACIGLIAIGLEISERIELHDLQLNFSFVFEAFLEGLMLPILGGLLLSLVDRSMRERYRVASELAAKKTLTQAINNAKDWNELIKTIVEFPRSTIPLIGSVLLINEPGTNRYKPESFWGMYGLNLDISNACHPGKICETCLINRDDEPLKRCNCEDSLLSDNEAALYCLPLVHANQAIALLYLYCSPKTQLESDQARLLGSLAPEMALAIDSASSKRLNVLLRENNDAELRRIARNMHDNLAQSLVYVRHKLDQLTGEDALKEITNLRKDLERMRQVVDDAYIDVRSTLKELESSVSADLPRMLMDCARLAEERSNLQVRLRTIGQPRPLPSRLARQVLAIFSEILTNIEKHAETQQADACLTWEGETLTLSVTDNGRGFEAHGSNGNHSNGHMGLSIMRERAAELTGTLTVRSEVGRGTEVTLRLPLTTDSKDAFLV